MKYVLVNVRALNQGDVDPVVGLFDSPEEAVQYAKAMEYTYTHISKVTMVM